MIKNGIWNKTFTLALKVIFTLVMIWIIFQLKIVSIHSFYTFFKPSNFIIALACMGLFLFVQYIASFRLTLLLNSQGLKISVYKCFQLTMIGNFFNSFIPGTFGGDVVKGYYLLKAEDNNKGKSTGILIVDRVIGLISVLIVCFLSIVYLLKGKLNAFIFNYYLYIITFFVTVFILLFILFLHFRNPTNIDRIKSFIKKIIRNQVILNVIVSFKNIIHSKIYLFIALLLSFINIILSSVIIIIIDVNFFQSQSNYLFTASVSSLVMLFGSIPVTIGNLGWNEYIAEYGWSSIGKSNGGEVFFYWRLIAILSSLIGGIFYLINPKVTYTKNNKMEMK